MMEEGDAHTLDLLMDMRKLCDEMNASFEHFHARFWELKQAISNPNTHGLSKELTFKVMQLETSDTYPENLRTISLNSNGEVGRAAFFAAVKCYPTRTWVLRWGMMVMERYDPPGTGIK
jgi:hypothetical protein